MFDTLAHLFVPKHTNNHRPRIIHPEGFFILSTLALVFHVMIRATPVIPGLSNVLGYASNITASQVLHEINARRAENGASPLTTDTQLTQAAVAKASDMFNQQYWAHNAPGGTTPWTFISNAGYDYISAGENLARDFGDTDSMVEAWMASPTHRENIVNGKFSETGIAVVDGIMQGVETTLVVQMFAAPSVAQAQIPPRAGQTEPIVADAVQAVVETQPEQTLGSVAIPELQAAPLVTPLQLSKSIFLAMVLLLVMVLAYDMLMADRKKTVRAVGKNLAHILLLVVVALAVIIFRSGALS